METVIYFVRHAQSRPSSQLHHSAWPLSDVGANQARALISLIKNLGIEHVVSSPFVRCLHTIKPFVDSHGTNLTIHEHLRERHVVDTMVDNFHEVWQRSWEDFNFKMPGCESSLDAQARFVEAMNEIVAEHAGRTIAVSTHGNVLGLFLNHIDSNHHRIEAEAIRNPDILRVVHTQSRFVWDRDFTVPGLDEIATHHKQTPVDK